MIIETFVVFLALLWMVAHALHKRIDDMNRRIDVPLLLDPSSGGHNRSGFCRDCTRRYGSLTLQRRRPRHELEPTALRA
jgi:hypothetical protein